MVKKRTYSLGLIRSDYSYTVEQIADIFSIDIDTVRRWLRKEGLNRIPKTRPYLVHSTELKTFLEKRQNKRKRPCAPNEMFCCSCQKSHPPKNGSVIAKELPNKSMRITGICPTRNTKMNRAVKAKDWSKKHPLAKYLHDATKQHNGEQLMPREYPVQQEMDLQ